MSFFHKSRPQNLFEMLWGLTFHIVSQIWQATLLIHSEQSPEIRSNLLSFLESKSRKVLEIDEQLSEMSKEIFEVFNKYYPESHKNEWYKFVEGITDFQRDLTMLEIRLFLFKDILMQIDKTNPQWEKLNETLQINYEKLIKAKSLVDNLVAETSQATHNAIVIARSIEENISFEEADKRVRKRWE